MDNNVFINKNSFTITSTEENVFICDKNIANTIAELNKKGYQTNSSCEGHIKFGWQEINNCDLSLLNKAKNDPRFIVLKINKDSFDYLTPNMLTSIYISFIKDYKFPNLPLGFSLDNDNNQIIRKTINYYDNNHKKTHQELEAEKEKYLNELYKWAKNLPNIANHKPEKTKPQQFCEEVTNLAQKYNLPFFIVTKGASATSNNGCEAVKNARDNHIKWENDHGFDPNEDWNQ